MRASSEVIDRLRSDYNILVRLGHSDHDDDSGLSQTLADETNIDFCRKCGCREDDGGGCDGPPERRYA